MVQHANQFFFVHDAITRWAEMMKLKFRVAEPQMLEEDEEGARDGLMVDEVILSQSISSAMAHAAWAWIAPVSRRGYSGCHKS